MESQKQTCNHTYVQQAQYGALPPLDFSPISAYSCAIPTEPATPEFLRKSTYTRLLLALQDLGQERVRSPFLAYKIHLPRQEIEYGMSRKRRERMVFYLLGIENLRMRAATELFLAKFSGSC